MYRTHTAGELTKKHAGERVTLAGWVHKRRDFGGVIFVDLRDRYGVTQVVFHPEKTANYAVAEGLKYEYVIQVSGTVVKRDKKNINKDLATGEVEIEVENVEVLSKAKAMPFEIFETGKGDEDEELRLRFRFLELRREKLRENILFRAQMVTRIRRYMEERNFVDIATPILTVSSPEGARDFLVPSRLHPGKFYALPQAPQQYKQLLMVAGFDRYYQIAPCMRDEDPRADRSPGEFYQLDCETSFLSRDEFFALMEPLFYELTAFAGKKMKQKPLPRIPYRTAMEIYGSDRPDLRFDLKIVDVTNWAKDCTNVNIFKNAECVRALAVPGGDAFSRKEIEEVYEDAAKRAKARGLAWMKFADGKFDGGIVKFFDEETLEKLKHALIERPLPHPPLQGEGTNTVNKNFALQNFYSQKTNPPPDRGRSGGGLNDGSIIFFVADNWETSCKALGAVRSLAGERLKLADPNEIAWAWIVDFPMYEWNAEKGNGGAWDFGHNPFSTPQGGLDALNTKNPGDILADQYDIIANGLELSSGAVRNKDAEVMYKAFEIAGYTKDDVNKKFGHMIEAFSYGAPPHCGFAPGIERLAMLLLGEPNIRAVVPFPKNQKAEEPMVGSPGEVEEKQLKELGLKIDIK